MTINEWASPDDITPFKFSVFQLKCMCRKIQNEIQNYKYVEYWIMKIVRKSPVSHEQNHRWNDFHTDVISHLYTYLYIYA